jgi:Creatinase/Prolidase N-terminal domain
VNNHLREVRDAADAAGGGHWAVLQAQMCAASIDALVLSQPGACSFAAGHERVAVMGGGAGAPAVIVPANGQPHVYTTNPDGALALDEHHVHAQSWNPVQVSQQIRSWIGDRPSLRIGFDLASPSVLARMSETFASVELIDANELLAGCMLVKSDAELRVLRALCSLLHDAIRIAGANRPDDLYERLGGAVPSIPWTFSESGVSVGASFRGFAAEARVGLADPEMLQAALDALAPGIAVSTLAKVVPVGVEVVGIGRGYEAPYVGAGRAWPSDVVLGPGAVLVVRSGRAAVTACVTERGYDLFSPPPREVAHAA